MDIGPLISHRRFRRVPTIMAERDSTQLEQASVTRTWLRRGGLGPLGSLTRSGSLGVVTAVAASTVVGALVVVAPAVAAGAFVLTLGALVAWTRPTLAIAACLVVASLHRGIFLYLRIEPAGYPLSVFDGVPLLLLLASVSLAVRARQSAFPRRGPLAICAAMILAGLVVGVTLGASRGAQSYELLRVVRLDALILCVLTSVLVAGHTPQWRRGVVIGLMAVAASVAVQLLITFSWSLATGNYFWSLFPFGRAVDDNLAGKVAAGNILTLRENAIAGFLLLPALSLLIFRFKGRDFVLLALLVAGGLVWLSRGLWLAMFLTLMIPLAHRAASRRLTGVRVATIAIPIVAIVSIVFLASGGILEERLADTTNLAGDISLEQRSAETQVNLNALGQGAGTLLFGLGAGVVAVPGSVALLENTVLSMWTNTGLLGLIGITALLFGAGTRGWQLASRSADRDSAALGAMSLALPVLWLQGLIGGVLSLEQSAVVVSVLAATALVTPVEARGRSTQPSQPDPRGDSTNEFFGGK